MDNPDRLLTKPRQGDDIYQRGLERGRVMADFIERRIGPLAGKRVLDVGCAWGGITLAFADRCDHIIGLELDFGRLQVARQRAVESATDNVSFSCGSVLAIPFDKASFDLVIMNGVLEWVASRDLAEAPRSYQLRALREIVRVLRPSGTLYLTLENRWFPRYLFSDPHVRMPLVAMLPRPLADVLSKAVRKQPYRTHIYSYRALQALLQEAGLGESLLFLPIPNYQFPLAIVEFGDRAGIAATLAELFRPGNPYKSIAQRRAGKVALWFRFITAIGMAKWLCPGFVALAQPNK